MWRLHHTHANPRQRSYGRRQPTQQQGRWNLHYASTSGRPALPVRCRPAPAARPPTPILQPRPRRAPTAHAPAAPPPPRRCGCRAWRTRPQTAPAWTRRAWQRWGHRPPRETRCAGGKERAVKARASKGSKAAPKICAHRFKDGNCRQRKTTGLAYTPHESEVHAAPRAATAAALPVQRVQLPAGEVALSHELPLLVLIIQHVVRHAARPRRARSHPATLARTGQHEPGEE